MNPSFPSSLGPSSLGPASLNPGPSHCTRFAPSPTGHLHLGHAHAALFAAAAAGPDGQFLLRIEDIDPVRCRPEFIDAIYEDLAWLGLIWPQPVRRQSQHLAEYAAVLDGLRARGLIYPCFCTRKDIEAEIERAGHAPHGPDGALYPGLCRAVPEAEAERRIAAGEAHAWRLNMAQALASASATAHAPLSFTEHGPDGTGAAVIPADPAQFGDVVLARKDVPVSYHLAVVWDDAVQGITLVTRGVDLRPAAHLHRLLQALLDLPVPDYRFHPLLLGPDGKRLAKRDRAATLREMRAAGMTPDQVFDQLRRSPTLV